ncbi:PL29 family lyase N-terminal domain-containing protein [Alistipes senegalensis]|uniref:PL29 family lyase N-terminal domain-containing protein n=1 Tax=Alistipes senegalensis TaxID=1288121 RepID=UPI0018A89975|nr:PL29 family lyase N-terminal domain-containing protein [Alistipes senegalensis]
MKNFFRFLLSAAAVLAMGACQQSDIDDLERDIDDLRSRLTALETQVDVLNNNLEALQKLLNGATVNTVEEKNGVYTITLSNGEVLTLTQGSEGGYYTPVIGVDAEGYWTVSFDGTNYTRIKGADGNPVQGVARPGATGSKGEDGVTPQFKVDASGNWLVSSDGGKNFTQVLDPDGKPVNAASGTATDKFFADVKVEGSVLTVTLLDGKTYEIPVVSDFKCVISGAGEVITFAQKETRDFDVTMAGVAATVVTAPEGWTASLTAKQNAAADAPTHTLTVGAPENKTRATADSRTDICILAVADNGLSTIAKLRVATGDAVLHTPTVKSVTVDASKTTETALTFSVEIDDANGWKYLCRPSADTAPTAAEVFEQGQAGNTGAVTTDGLTAGTAYTIYVAAYYDTTVGTTLGTAEVHTLKAAVDYWEAGVTLAGVTYDKNTSGAQLITATTEISAPGVYFLDPADGAQITLAKCTATELVLIGRHSKTRAKISVTTGPISLGNGRGLILKNVELDAGEYTAYLFNFASGSFVCENLAFEDSKIIMPRPSGTGGPHGSYFSNANASIRSIAFENSIVAVNPTKADCMSRLLNFNTGSGSIAENGSVVFRNCVFYSAENPIGGTLFHVNAAAQTLPTVNISVTNCSMINYVGYYRYFQLATVKSVDFSKNILYCKDYAKDSYTFNFLVDPGCEPNYTDNIVYGLNPDNAGCWKYAQASSVLTLPGNYVKEDSDPFRAMDFATDTFIPADNAYGANL